MKKIVKRVDVETVVRKVQKVNAVVVPIVTVVVSLGMTVFADNKANDGAKKAIKNVIEIVSYFVTGIGVLIALWGGLQVGTSFSAHDTSQRATGALTLLGGVFIAFLPWILMSIFEGNSEATSYIPTVK